MQALNRPNVAIRAALSFAATRTNDGIWSNGLPHLVTQSLRDHVVELRDAAKLTVPPSLQHEGFVRVIDPVKDPAWEDATWDLQTYLPQCALLVKRLTGAAQVLAQGGSMLRDTGDPTKIAAARFVHLDKSREAALPFIASLADEDTRRRFPRVKIYNVWRAITPPPQDVPLALCDRRTVDQSDSVVGRTIESSHPDGVAYLTSVHNPSQQWYYFPELDRNQALVFQQFDSDETVPMGCLHGAFRHPEPPAGAVPRASVESRFIAFFER